MSRPFLSQCFFSLAPENFKNGKVFQAFKSVDERNIDHKPQLVNRAVNKGFTKRLS